MATTRASSRAASNARNDILSQLKDDHKRVKKAYRDFKKLDPQEQPEECEAIVRQVLEELQVHAALEEELLYPAAREAIAEEQLIDEAEVEHESIHALIEQLNSMAPDDEKFAARFTVLCEYVLHHVKEEEGEMFPQLERVRGFDWTALAEAMTARREELTAAGAEGSEGAEMAGAGEPVADEPPATGVVRSGGASSRKI
jgi:hemerythrin superfamily protein